MYGSLSTEEDPKLSRRGVLSINFPKNTFKPHMWGYLNSGALKEHVTCTVVLVPHPKMEAQAQLVCQT